MRIRQLFRGIRNLQIRGNRELIIRGISSDSRKTAPGDLFIARKGAQHDASKYISEAIQAGAIGVVTELYDPFHNITQIISENPGSLEAEIAARFYQYPSKELFVVGITGSKGKTTTSYLIQHLIGPDCGLMSTVETIIRGEKRPSHLTTHEPIYNQKILRQMKSKGCTSVAFEVSSHGLALGRTEKIDFDLAIFTNLYPDHLDFHGTIEEYAKAKRKLFCIAKKLCIFNSDSPWTSYMRTDVASFTYGIDHPADLCATELTHSIDGISFRIGTTLFQSSLIGRHNVYNLLAATSVGLYLGMSLESIANRLSSFHTVPGRLERIPNRHGIQLFVDFAHTGDALESVLKSLKQIAPKRLLVLFGAGGNRDPARRKSMAIAADRYADLSIVTSDNPRNESPDQIIQEILEGFTDPSKILVEADRKRAIHLAIAQATEGDVVLIAGKGHEKTQIIGNQTSPFDDVVVAKEALF